MGSRRTGGGALRYALPWITGGAAAALAIIALVGLLGGGEPPLAPEPVREPSLAAAAPAAGCRLLTGRSARPPDPVSEGPAGPAAAPGVYEQPLSRAAIAGALRHGIAVVQHRPDLPEEAVAALHGLAEDVPEGTIVTVNARMRPAAAIAAWRRVLLCPRVDERAIDALVLFRGRFLGSGPDATPLPGG